VSFLKKSTKNVHVFRKLLTLHVDAKNQLPTAFNPPKNSSGQEKNWSSKMAYSNLWFANSKNKISSNSFVIAYTSRP